MWMLQCMCSLGWSAANPCCGACRPVSAIALTVMLSDVCAMPAQLGPLLFLRRRPRIWFKVKNSSPCRQPPSSASLADVVSVKPTVYKSAGGLRVVREALVRGLARLAGPPSLVRLSLRSGCLRVWLLVISCFV